jgi:hypothetical protein
MSAIRRSSATSASGHSSIAVSASAELWSGPPLIRSKISR